MFRSLLDQNAAEEGDARRCFTIGSFCSVVFSKAGPAFTPFDYSYALRIKEIFRQASPDDLQRSLKPVQIQMKQRQPALAVFVYQGKSWGLDARDDTETAREAFHELGFARAKISAEADDPTGPGVAAPLLTERGGFFRVMRNERSHERSVGERRLYRASARPVPP